MAIRSDDPLEQTVYDMLSYIRYVKETFIDESAKYQEFLKAVNGICKDHRVLSGIAKVEEIMKDHPQLMSGFTVLLPTAFDKIVKPEPTFGDAISYIASVKRTFRDEPAKIDEFVNMLKEVVTRRVDEASGVAKLKELIKDQPDLLLRFNVFLPSGDTEITKAEQLTKDFLKNLKKRFQSHETHVYKSFLKLMNDSKEGKMSIKEMQEEVVQLLYYHEDLIHEFNSFFS